jgi:hypothetical protein
MGLLNRSSQSWEFKLRLERAAAVIPRRNRARLTIVNFSENGAQAVQSLRRRIFGGARDFTNRRRGAAPRRMR